MKRHAEVLVLSCYELGHQPLAAASTLAFLDQAGYRPSALDLSVERLDESKLACARFVGVSVPMHTALRLGVRAARRVRALRPTAHICFFGLYATLNADYLLREVADSVIGGEFEAPLVGLVQALDRGEAPESVEGVGLADRPAGPHLQRLLFPVPLRSPLPALDRYAHLEHAGEQRPAAAVETTRGCLHLCRHCPIPPVYGGRLFVVPREAVLGDIRQCVAAGARHITFADPDFLNGPTHSVRIVRAMHEEFPGLTFDFTAKVEHVLKHRGLFPEMAARGCLFVVSAVESLSDTVLGYLAKGHTRDDVFEALDILRGAGVALRPSFVPFTPWATVRDYENLLDWVEGDGLVHHVDPVQLSIRLLVPPGSLLISLAAMRPHLREPMQQDFTYRWEHPDPRMDELHRRTSLIVRQAASRDEDPQETLLELRRAYAGIARKTALPAVSRALPARIGARPPRLTEAWFC